MTRILLLGVAAQCVLLNGTVAGELNYLTPREAVRVLQQLPYVLEVQRRGGCPRFDASYGDSTDRIGVVVRGGCGPDAGSLLGSYEVDLKTGSTFELESRQRIVNPGGDSLAQALLKKARMRVLSPRETRCLALAAVKSLPGWDGRENEVTVESTGAFDIHFKASLHTRDPPAIVEKAFTVDRATGQVLDERRGLPVMTPALMSLVSKMLALHLPPMLSETDALAIARAVPEMQEQAKRPCSVFRVGGPLSWTDVYVSVVSHCDGSSEGSALLLAVSPETGAVSDPENKIRFQTALAARVAQERLQRLTRERLDETERLDSVCREQ